MKFTNCELIIEQTVFLAFYMFHLGLEILITVLLLLSTPFPHRSPSSHGTSSQKALISQYLQTQFPCITQALVTAIFFNMFSEKLMVLYDYDYPTERHIKTIFCSQATNVLSLVQIKPDREIHGVSLWWTQTITSFLFPTGALFNHDPNLFAKNSVKCMRQGCRLLNISPLTFSSFVQTFQHFLQC